MYLRKRILIPVVLVAAVALWIPRQRQIAASQRALEAMQLHVTELTNNIMVVTRELASFKENLRDHNATRQELRTSVAKAERELARTDPESAWTTVPAELPDWNSDSPYIWVRKEAMKDVSAEPFGEDGSLLPQAAPLLAIDSALLKELNTKLKDILAEYQQIELTNVVLSDEHLLSVGPVGKGKAITVSWEPSDEGIRLKNEYEAALRLALGEQRTELLLAVDRGEISSSFGRSHNGSETQKKITLLRHPDGRYNIAIDKGNSSMSTAAPKGNVGYLNNYIPQHVRHFFAEILDASQ